MIMPERIPFDSSATTPIDPRVRQAMAPFLDGAFGNPSSLNQAGREVREATDRARRLLWVTQGCFSSRAKVDRFVDILTHVVLDLRPIATYSAMQA
jgi:hypothetical protein